MSVGEHRYAPAVATLLRPVHARDRRYGRSGRSGRHAEDALYGILFRDINMQRTIVDQYFSRVINGYAGVIINTGEG